METGKRKDKKSGRTVVNIFFFYSHLHFLMGVVRGHSDGIRWKGGMDARAVRTLSCFVGRSMDDALCLRIPCKIVVCCCYLGVPLLREAVLGGCGCIGR